MNKEINGLKEGYWEDYFDNGKLYNKGNYVNGKKEGYWEEYHDNGEICSKGCYKNDEEIGEWLYFNTKKILVNREYTIM